MCYTRGQMSNENKQQKREKEPKNKFKLKSVAKKEKISERNRLKQNLRDIVENGFFDDDFDDETMR